VETVKPFANHPKFDIAQRAATKIAPFRAAG
jgi:hypothetical protein